MNNTTVLWSELTAPELNTLATQGACVLVPVGSTEQHGPHLVTGTDSILASEVCKRAALAMHADGHPCVVAPPLWFGLADHHVDLGGTFTLSLATYSAVLADICASIRGAGFSDIVLVNGHGGNMAALTAIANDMAVRSGLLVYSTTYFIEAAAQINDLLETQSGLQHAGEAETSMIWAISPQMVRTDALVDGPNFDLQTVLQPRLRRFEPFAELTPNGVSGQAKKATAAKGDALLAASATVLARNLMYRGHTA